MNKDPNVEKQIEEMTKVIDQAKHDMWVGECPTYDEHSKNIAKYLYNAGYHKASEVAGEFIEAVDQMMELVVAMTGCSFTYFGKYAELKKKYTEGVE